MSIRVEELAGASLSYDPRNPGATIPYVAWGSDVESVLRAALLAAVPAYFGGMPLRSLQPKEDKNGVGVWFADAVYGLADAQTGSNPTSSTTSPPPPPPPTEDTVIGSQYGFQWAAPTGKYTQSKETLDTVVVTGATAPDFKRAIGVQPDGTVEGVDLPSWPEAISLTAVIPNFTLKYLKACRALAGKTNATAFLAHAAGKLLYLGGSAQPREGGGMTVTHRFASGEFQIIEADDFAPGFPAFTVDPFAYVWVWYTAAVDAGRTVQKPTAAYVERLYDSGDYSVLGLFA